MRIRGVLLCFVLLLIPIVFMISIAFKQQPSVQLDTVEVNDVVKTLSEHWPDILKSGKLPFFEYRLDFALIDNDGNLIAATRQGLSESINGAIQNRDTIVDIISDNGIVGKVIFYNGTVRILEQNRAGTIYTAILLIVVLLIVCAGYTVYLHFTILRPFQKMKAYAGQIAAGNLDIPLKMDRHNLFGAFTASFDLMREELHKARENERKADLSKKELVASLSHDIKTPVASIKAVTEFMTLTAKDEEDKRQLEVINRKAEQINSLITNMFHATLEELQMLYVLAAEVQSSEVSGLIQASDYKRFVKPFSMPSCIIMADLSRLQQVFDNIISNSYKYAGTEIEINAAIEAGSLVINIIDFGVGVPKEEQPLIFNKFYRGKNTGDKNGYGLGLYISRYLMEQMSGGIHAENRHDGFSVRLELRLA